MRNVVEERMKEGCAGCSNDNYFRQPLKVAQRTPSVMDAKTFIRLPCTRFTARQTKKPPFEGQVRHIAF